MSIDHFNLRSFDLNLLVAFDALMTEQSVTRAAQRLRIGQPAMSHALATLRMLLQDELFVRSGQTMQPTLRTRALAGPIRQLLLQAEAALRQQQVFDPATECRLFRIAMSPEVEVFVLPALVALIGRAAPGVYVQSVPAQGNDIDAALENGGVDLVVGCRPASPATGESSVLYEVDATCCYNPALVEIRGPISFDGYIAARHALASQDGSLQGYIRDALRAAGPQLNVVMEPMGFFSALAAAQASPLVATVARDVAERFGRPLGLVVDALPIPLSLPAVRMRWGRHAANDPAIGWLRERVREASEKRRSPPCPS
ncbi:LysR family transcriptional regulator [Oceanicella sp. SM1341]|uniref:LysR family transcriptional regulator n=1 Tax=Oceanicella sp. SM1341 TaxID=1548889 RepID=UPI0018E4F070|nr:LysR family transcriptional regulator [Oceanicella sp. SM1341]